MVLKTAQSERLVGAWAKARGIRDQLVIATKYTIGYKNTDPDIKVKVQHDSEEAALHLADSCIHHVR